MARHRRPDDEESPAPPLRPRMPGAVVSSRRHLRARLAGRWTLWTASTLSVTVLWVVMTGSALVVDTAVAGGEVVEAEVSRVVEDEEEEIYDVYVTARGNEYELDDFPPLYSFQDLFADLPDYRIGDRVEIAVDPDLDGLAYDVALYRPFSWSAALLGFGFLVGTTATLRAFFTRHWLLRDAVRWQWWVRPTVTEATVLQVRDPAPPARLSRLRRAAVRLLHAVLVDDDDHQEHLLVVEVDGRPRLWHAKSARETSIEEGMTFDVLLGRPRSRPWAVGLTEPELYPLERLD